MTRNQIDFWNMKEAGRHNKSTETEVARHNKVSEAVDIGDLSERTRHNKMSEAVDVGNLRELSRHNLATERVADRNTIISKFNAAENARHNKASEALTGTDLNIRAGTLQESIRHNVASEGIQQQQADTAALIGVADAALKDAQTLWTKIKGSSDLELTDAQIRKIDQEIAKMQNDIRMGKVDRVIDAINAAGNAVGTGAKLLDALIPF